MKETNIVRSVMLKLGSIKGVRIFRNNQGTAWIGKSVVFHDNRTVNVKKGDVLIENARVFHAGLCKGSSDLIGLKSVIITPEMVGKPVAVFLAPEIKTKSGRASVEQIAFLKMVNDLGGIGFIATDENEAFELLNSKP